MTKEEVFENRNDIGLCPCCNRNIKDRKIALFKGLMNALYQVYCWCGKENKHEFETKEIKHLLGKNEYARFGDLIRFGGILYKPESGTNNKAHFGINMKRAKDFFHGKSQIPIQITIEQFTGKIVNEVRGSILDIPELYAFLNEDGMYDYEKDIPKLF